MVLVACLSAPFAPRRSVTGVDSVDIFVTMSVSRLFDIYIIVQNIFLLPDLVMQFQVIVKYTQQVINPDLFLYLFVVDIFLKVPQALLCLMLSTCL